MANQIFATLDKSGKWLDKQREIDGYPVDGFTVIPCFNGKAFRKIHVGDAIKGYAELKEV